MQIIVIGAGIVGQLIKWAVPSARVLDARLPPPMLGKTLTRHWGTNYLWKPIPGIECRQFRVVTHIDHAPATDASIRAYKRKVGKEYESEQDWKFQFIEHATGYEFVSMPKIPVEWNSGVSRIDYRNKILYLKDQTSIKYDVLISTLPLFTLLNICGIREREIWRSAPIFVRVGARPPDAPFASDVMYVNYISNPKVLAYRVTDRESERHWESLAPMPGQIENKKLMPGKIYPHTTAIFHRKFLRTQNIFTFGRYGSWQPDELVHQTWEQIVEWRESVIPDYVA